MTESRPRPARHRRPSAWPIAAGSLALFAVVLAFLALQLKAGRDPALGAGNPKPAKRVLVRRVEKRVVIERVVRDGSDEESDDGAVDDDAAPSSGATSVAAAPAPAPVPAPITTQSS